MQAQLPVSSSQKQDDGTHTPSRLGRHSSPSAQPVSRQVSDGSGVSHPVGFSSWQVPSTQLSASPPPSQSLSVSQSRPSQVSMKQASVAAQAHSPESVQKQLVDA